MSATRSTMLKHRTLTEDQQALYRSMLEEQWRYQVDDIVELSHDALEDIADRDEDGSRTTDQLLNSRLLAAARQQLQETEDALARLDDGSYGACARCGERIGPERLEILPAAALCVACQSRRPQR